MGKGRSAELGAGGLQRGSERSLYSGIAAGVRCGRWAASIAFGVRGEGGSGGEGAVGAGGGEAGGGAEPSPCMMVITTTHLNRDHDSSQQVLNGRCYCLDIIF